MYVCSVAVILVVTGWPYRSVVDLEVFVMLSTTHYTATIHCNAVCIQYYVELKILWPPSQLL